MSVLNSNLFYLLSEAVQTGELKYYGDERAKNYLQTKLKDIIPEDKLSNVISYFFKVLLSKMKENLHN